MDSPRLNDVIALVVAWHNRHPLARRIAAHQVHSVGAVALPFAMRPSALLPPGDQPDTPAESAPPGTRLARLRGWFARHVPGLGAAALHAAFSRDFAWPTAPARIARFARRHGRAERFVTDDWPQRDIDIDPALQRRLQERGLAQPLSLHLMSAAVGVGDRRLRLFIGADLSVIGPRAYGPARIAFGTSLAVALLMSAGWAGRFQTGDPASGPVTAQLIARTTPPASSPAVRVAAVAASKPALAASTVAVAAAAAASANALPTVARRAPAAAPPGSAAASRPSAADPVGMAVATATATATPTATSTATPLASPARIPGPIKPVLSADDRRAALAQSVALRQGAAAPGPVYALVTLPTRQRELSEAQLARLQAARAHAQPPAPTRSELIQAHGHWRAAWWPFTSLGEAERARVMLSARGLKAEVVEF